VGRQLFSALLDRLGVDQDKGEDLRLRTLGDPGVHVPRCTQMSPAFIGTALEVDRLAEGLGAVYEFRPPPGVNSTTAELSWRTTFPQIPGSSVRRSRPNCGCASR